MVKSRHGINYRQRFSSSDNLNDCNTKANPRSLLTKGCESLTVTYQASIWASLEMESFDWFLNTPPCTYKNKKHCGRQYQILGAFTFWSTYKQSCAFSKKLEHGGEPKTKKEKKKKTWRLCYCKKEATKEVGVCKMCFLERKPRPGSLTGFSAPCCSDGSSDPVQSPLPHKSPLSPTKAGLKVAFVTTGMEEQGNGAWPPWQRHHPSYRLCSWVTVVVFIIFGYKVIQLKGSDWNKAMWEERGVQCMMGGASRRRLLLFDGCREEEETWESDPNTGDNVAAAGLETYFLLWAGGFSPGSQSSSAWTCQSWRLLKCLACRSSLQICKQTSQNSGCVGLCNNVKHSLIFRPIIRSFGQ